MRLQEGVGRRRARPEALILLLLTTCSLATLRFSHQRLWRRPCPALRPWISISTPCSQRVAPAPVPAAVATAEGSVAGTLVATVVGQVQTEAAVALQDRPPTLTLGAGAGAGAVAAAEAAAAVALEVAGRTRRGQGPRFSIACSGQLNLSPR